MNTEIFSLAGKTAAVTGASSGIGRGIAVELARMGAKVLVLGRNLERTEETVQLIQAIGGEARAMRCDVTQDADVSAFLKEAGELDIFVSNAGLCVTGAFLSTTREEVADTLATNLPVPLLQGVLKLMRQQGRGGNVILVSSVNSMLPLPNQAVYSSTKAALENLTKSLAYTFAADGIRVNCVAPGATRNGVKLDPTFEKEFPKTIPLGRFGEPEDVGRATAFLVSQAASYITGATLTIDGGLLLRPDLVF